MNSVKTKTKKYYLSLGKAIAQVVFAATPLGYKMYVAWEWPNMADKGFFAIMKQPTGVCLQLDDAGINYVANFGEDVTHTEEARLLFANLFK